MIIASAQTKPVTGDISKNLTDHYSLINIATDNGADLIVFPEMSITGYSRENANKLKFTEKDDRLNEFKRLSIEKKIVIIAGTPVEINTDLFIGSYIFSPNGYVSIYTKQFLHPGEELFFKSSFNYNPVIELHDEKISLATCFDIENNVHAEKAGKIKTTLYIPSIFYSTIGMHEAHILLSGYAKKYSMNILMSNYVGPTWGIEAGGKSAFWNKDGELIAELDSINTGLLIVKKNKGIWEGLAIHDHK